MCCLALKLLRPTIKNLHHQDHSGITKTYLQLKLKYYTPNMCDLVQQIVSTCPICEA